MWPFKKKPDYVEPDPPEKVVVTPESVQPPDVFIEGVLDENRIFIRSFYEIPRQYVNWASEQIGEPAKYKVGSFATVRSCWVLYEGCKAYKEKQNDTSTN